MDPVQIAPAASSFAEKFGFPALLVLVLFAGIYLLFKANAKERSERDERDERRELVRVAERKEDREAHLGALGKHTEVIGKLGESLVRVETKVDTLDRDVTDLKNRKAS